MIANGSSNLHFSRREALRLLGAAGATALVGWKETPAGSPSCVVRPSQTEGPYFIDERLDRSDIRMDPKSGAMRPGVPLDLRINVSRVTADACAPLSGAHVDVWQCDALGEYSDVADDRARFDTRGQGFLRGYQVTNESGSVDFVTIYPGWYSGRTVHVHFKIRLFAGAQPTHEFTSQLYFDDETTDRVQGQAPYASKGPRGTRNDRDRIFRSRGSGAQLMLGLTESGRGYAGSFDIGLAGV